MPVDYCSWSFLVRNIADEVLFRLCFTYQRCSLAGEFGYFFSTTDCYNKFQFGKLNLKATHKHKSPSEVRSQFLLTPTKVPSFSKQLSLFLYGFGTGHLCYPELSLSSQNYVQLLSLLVCYLHPMCWFLSECSNLTKTQQAVTWSVCLPVFTI